jgi:broad specificity phosphatase PhoE
MAQRKFKYQAVSGFFAQDDPRASPQVIGALPPHIGLLDNSPDRWTSFTSKISLLNREATSGTQYKVLFLGRHGEGYHNVAEAKYGTEAWNEYWSKLDGDGELAWGPDPDLTDTGKDQAAMAHTSWIEELAFGLPLPEKLYCSPMTRALQTHAITFNGIIDKSYKTVVLENCREEYGEHTCDKRKSRSLIQSAFPDVKLEDTFTEEDQLWTPEREPEEHVISRAKNVLDRIFTIDTEQFISITAHGGIINAFLRVIGRQHYGLLTGGLLPVVIKSTVYAE